MRLHLIAAILIGVFAVFVIDVIAAAASRRFVIKYVDIALLSVAAWTVAGILAAQAAEPLSRAPFLGALAAGAVGLIDGGIGWWVSAPIGVEARPRGRGFRERLGQRLRIAIRTMLRGVAVGAVAGAVVWLVSAPA